MLGIVDYGMANLRSVQKAFERCGHAAQIIATPDDIEHADRLVVPGVGAFRDAISLMNRTGLGQAIKDFIKTGRPMLGICLGLQLLMEVGYEDGTHKGLGLIPGDCLRFTVDAPPLKLKVPHMGWNSLQFAKPSPLFKGLPENPFAYFVHSYHIVPKDAGIIAATADYGTPFVAAIWKDNIMATQFHPEKSQEVGAAILKNFAEYNL
ncbi:MAG TPA: imidazole glycerol phosphate synthase subunit HisH [Phycisphaerae bacterium]